MMLRGGTRYLIVSRCVAQSSSGTVCFLAARALSSVAPSSGPSCRVAFSLWSQTPRPAGATAPRRLPGFFVARSANYRLWSSGKKTPENSKETAPLTGGEPSSSSPVKSALKEEEELEQLIDEELEPQSWRQRAKTFAVVYGRVGICTHIALSLLSFSVIYVGVSSGVDVKSILDALGISSSASDTTTNSAGSFLIAYTIYKLLAPIRWPLTFAVTPIVLRGLRSRGYMLAESSSPTNSRSSPPPQ